MENLYDILGVQQNAADAEIKKAFRALSKKYHPDVNPGNKKAEEKFRAVSEAYAILQDPQKRKEYDKKLEGEKQSAYHKAANNKDIYSTEKGTGFDFNNMDEQFARFFGFHPKSTDVNSEQFQRTEKTKTNPIDMTDLFEKYMGIRK